MARRWRDLSDRTRRLIVAAAAVETVLKIVMLADLERRPADQVRGSKKVWAATALVNTAGVAPLAYLTLGRRRS